MMEAVAVLLKLIFILVCVFWTTVIVLALAESCSKRLRLWMARQGFGSVVLITFVVVGCASLVVFW
jgi:hypothetical protein